LRLSLISTKIQKSLIIICLLYLCLLCCLVVCELLPLIACSSWDLSPQNLLCILDKAVEFYLVCAFDQNRRSRREERDMTIIEDPWAKLWEIIQLAGVKLKWELAASFTQYWLVCNPNASSWFNAALNRAVKFKILILETSFLLTSWYLEELTRRSWRCRHRTRTTLRGKNLWPVSVENDVGWWWFSTETGHRFFPLSVVLVRCLHLQDLLKSWFLCFIDCP